MSNIYLKELKENGFCVVENVLSVEEIGKCKVSFYDWLESSKQIKDLHSKVSLHNIFKHFEVGHQYFAWYIRTRPKVQEVFKKIWETEELVVSFDGACWISKEQNKKTSVWTHTDQAPASKGFKCCQGFVSLTDNEERTLVVYAKSHLLHESYMKLKELTHKKNWQKIDIDYLESISNTKTVVAVKAGSLVLWDSRTFHQNQYGKSGEERMIQYVCFLPKNVTENSKSMKAKRQKYFEERRTTSHWPYPITVNGKQPRTYGDASLLIDYNKLQIPYLSDLSSEISKIL